MIWSERCADVERMWSELGKRGGNILLLEVSLRSLNRLNMVVLLIWARKGGTNWNWDLDRIGTQGWKEFWGSRGAVESR